MGEPVEYPSNGSTGQGWLATPPEGTGPGVVVIQEWWGLVPHIKDVCERFAAEGFVAVAPDLYHGKTTTEPDEADRLSMGLDVERATKEMGGAVDFVAERAQGDGVGVVGFCAGGGLALIVACDRPDRVKACVPFYGFVRWESARPDYSRLGAAVQGHFAEHDQLADPDSVRALEEELRGLGKEVEFFTYPGTDHAFFNDDRPEVFVPEAAATAWERTIEFLRSHLA
jgi:carboxymethylenebutenolidase